MNKFATIIPINRFSRTKVKIYTVQIEDETGIKAETEFENWISRHQSDLEIQKDLGLIRSWVEIISKGKHNLNILLRDENAAHALPPKTKFLEIDYAPTLRLYGMVIGNKTLILFNGGIKTKAKAQDCPNVAPYFHEANKLCRAIEESLRDSLELNYSTGEFNNPDQTEIDL